MVGPPLLTRPLEPGLSDGGNGGRGNGNGNGGGGDGCREEW